MLASATTVHVAAVVYTVGIYGVLCFPFFFMFCGWIEDGQGPRTAVLLGGNRRLLNVTVCNTSRPVSVLAVRSKQVLLRGNAL